MFIENYFNNLLTPETFILYFVLPLFAFFYHYVYNNTAKLVLRNIFIKLVTRINILFGSFFLLLALSGLVGTTYLLAIALPILLANFSIPLLIVLIFLYLYGVGFTYYTIWFGLDTIDRSLISLKREKAMIELAKNFTTTHLCISCGLEFYSKKGDKCRECGSEAILPIEKLKYSENPPVKSYIDSLFKKSKKKKP